MLSQHEEEFLRDQDYAEKENSGEANAHENEIELQMSHSKRKKPQVGKRHISANKEAKETQRKKLKVRTFAIVYQARINACR